MVVDSRDAALILFVVPYRLGWTISGAAAPPRRFEDALITRNALPSLASRMCSLKLCMVPHSADCRSWRHGSRRNRCRLRSERSGFGQTWIAQPARPKGAQEFLTSRACRDGYDPFFLERSPIKRAAVRAAVDGAHEWATCPFARVRGDFVGGPACGIGALQYGWLPCTGLSLTAARSDRERSDSVSMPAPRATCVRSRSHPRQTAVGERAGYRDVDS